MLDWRTLQWQAGFRAETLTPLQRCLQLKFHSFVVSQTSTNANFGVDFFSLTALHTWPSIMQFDQATGSSEWAASSWWCPCFLLLIGQHTANYCHSILQIAWPIPQQFLAISDVEGLLWASQEGPGMVVQLTRVTKCLSKGRLCSTPFPQGWIPDTVILEGMFIIHTTHLPSHSNMLNYTMFLLQWFVAPYSQLNVHIVFDDPERLKNQAIQWVRQNSASISQHDHLHFSDDSLPAFNVFSSAEEADTSLVTWRQV